MGRRTVALLSQQSDVFGGGEHSLLLLLEGLVERDVSVRLVCPRPGELSERATALHVETCFAPMPRLRGRSILGVPGALVRLAAALDGVRLVHAHAVRPMLLASLLGLDAPRLWHVRNPEREPLLDRWLGRSAARILAVSREVADRFAWPEIRGRVRVVPNGVCLERFHPAADRHKLRETLGLREGRSLVFAAARLEWEKGFESLVAAMARVGGAELAIAGTGPDRDHLERRARELGVAVRWLGQVADLVPWLQVADVVVSPSMVEGFGRLAIEAMACGRPVVASAVGGLRESLRDGESGRLVPPGDPLAIARAIQALLEDPGRAERLGRNARRRAERYFSSDAHVRAVIDVYHELEPGLAPGEARRAATPGEAACASV